MLLRDWRNQQNWTLVRLAREVSLLVGRDLHYRTIHRYETGENQTPTDIVEALKHLTEGAVGPEDAHAARAGYLQAKGALKRLTE